MRVGIVTAIYPPEPVVSALTSRDVAECLRDRGHAVLVITSFPNRPSGVLYPGYSRRPWLKEKSNGVDVLRTWHFLSSKSTLFSRAAENFSFGLTSSVAAVMKKFDVVYVNTWPLFSQFFTTLSSLVRSVPLVVSVQDLYPESLELKRMTRSRSWLARAMHRLDAFVLGQARYVVTISETMRDYVEASRQLAPGRVVCIPNWQDERLFPPELPRFGAFRKKHNIPDDQFICMFAGSITMSAGVDLYLDAARILKEHTDIMLIIAGDGSRRGWMEREIANRNLRNIRIIHPLDPKDVPETQAAADVLMLSLTGATAHNAAPSKLIAYMLSGRPVIASVSQDSTPAKIIHDAKAGFVIQPDDPGALAKQILHCRDRTQELVVLGKAARRYALQHFSRSLLLPRLCDLIEVAGCS